MVVRVLLSFGGLVAVLVVAAIIGVVPGLRPAAEAQVYGTTPIPPDLAVQPERVVTEAIPQAPPAVTPAVVAAPIPSAAPVPAPPAPAPVAPSPPATEPAALPPAVVSPPVTAVDVAPTLGAAPVVPAGAVAAVQSASTVQALPNVGTGGPLVADTSLTRWMLGGLAVMIGSLIAGTGLVARRRAQVSSQSQRSRRT
jgi:pyruvate dehydrogenase E2 component (dihydrolipoamide acetyltransferase)